MSLSLKPKLIINFLVVLLITGFVATWVGMRLIGDVIIRQAQDKVRTDLNSAREIYNKKLEKVEDVVRLTARRFFIRQTFRTGDLSRLREELNRIRVQERLDILTLTDAVGNVIYRAGNPAGRGDVQGGIVARTLITQKGVTSTELITREELLKEDAALAARARIAILPTPRAKPRPDSEETTGMLVKSAAPILDDGGRVLGSLYGGILLNRQYEIVDKIKETVYQDEVYEGNDIGTATIFQGDLRISTNVTRADGTRAIGTRVSEEVFDQVLVRGLPWIERAFVVNAWYITAYEPIRNANNAIIGILYVGMLEKKFTDMRRATIFFFLAITLAGLLAAFIISYFLANGIVKPIRELVFASEQLAGGDLTHRVRHYPENEIGELANTFNFMADSLKERDERIQQYTQQTIMESERLATVGQLAAGVAHELNNPLGGVLIYSHLMLESLPGEDPQRANLEKIVAQATRCKNIVKGLLDFSRQSDPTTDPADINELLNSTMALIENQAIFQNIEIKKDLSPALPKILVDSSQIQQVFINIILNAAEAMDGHGKLTIQTELSGDGRWLKMAFSDTGHGIAEADIERLFEPFFTTKEVGRGTGLGLAIAYGIIQRHLGTIEVTSEIQKGTTFLIQLPARKEVA